MREEKDRIESRGMKQWAIVKVTSFNAQGPGHKSVTRAKMKVKINTMAYGNDTITMKKAGKRPKKNCDDGLRPTK